MMIHKSCTREMIFILFVLCGVAICYGNIPKEINSNKFELPYNDLAVTSLSLSKNTTLEKQNEDLLISRKHPLQFNDDLGQTIMNINSIYMNRNTSFARSNPTRLVEGDLKVPTLKSVALEARKWPKTQSGYRKGYVEIPYTFAKEFSTKNRMSIQTALSSFSKHTCIRFVHKRISNGPHIDIVDKNGCYSSLGMTSYYGQEVSLRLPACASKSVVLHEMMHALGFIHEHRRSDRDEYVKINRDEITPGLYYSFKKTKSRNLVVYDYGSIMHYSTTTFSKTPWLRTIEVIPSGRKTAQIGRTKTLSSYDIENINYFYDCKPGTFQRCGKDFIDQKEGSFQSPNYPSIYSKESHCTWKITVNPGRFVKVTFQNIKMPDSVYCQEDAILVHDGVNAGAPVLQRICGTIKLKEVVSSGRNMFVIFSSDDHQKENEMGFKANFIESLFRGIHSRTKLKYVSHTLLPTNHTIKTFQCNFENGMCGMYQDKRDDFDWIRVKGPRPSSSTGPSADHTTGKGYYLVVPTINENLERTDTAIIRTPWMKRCQIFHISFSYHMFGELMGELRLYGFEMKKDKRIREVVLFQKQRNQGKIWNSATVQFRPTRNAKFVHFFWKAYRFDWDSEIALDDIKIVSTGCPSVTYKRRIFTKKTIGTLNIKPTNIISMYPTTKAGIKSATSKNVTKYLPGLPFCNFDYDASKSTKKHHVYRVLSNFKRDLGEYNYPEFTSNNFLCGWNQLSGGMDNFDWTRNRGRTRSSGTGPTADHTTRKGHYMYIESSKPRKLNDYAILQTYPMIPMRYCIDMYYHMHGSSIGKLSLTSIETDKNIQSTRSVLRSIKGPQRGIWMRLRVNYLPKNKPSELLFRLEGIVGKGYRGDIAIDDVSIIPGRCDDCQRPTHRYRNKQNKQLRFVSGCADSRLFWVRCCNHRRNKIVYRRVERCNRNIFSSKELNWFCSYT